MSNRVVITGMGIVSSLGRELNEVSAALQKGESCVKFNPIYQEKGLKSHVYAPPQEIDFSKEIPRTHRRFMAGGGAYAYLAFLDALSDSGLSLEDIKNELTGVIVGSGGTSPSDQVRSENVRLESGVRHIGPYGVTRNMASSIPATLSTFFGIRGLSYSLSAACTTSLFCVGNAYSLIRSGVQDIMFAGGGEEENYLFSMLFDAMGALSSRYNEEPHRASRTFDKNRDGFVISSGSGMLVLESLEHAQKRGAKIYGEIVGYGFSSDGHNMVAPSGEGAARCAAMALKESGPVDYINAHGTSTPIGDTKELEAMKRVFGDAASVPPISSTKSMSGHSQGATGVHEIIYSLLMMRDSFIAPSINIDEMDSEGVGMDIVQSTREVKLNQVMSNSFGFGGSNGSLVMRKFSD